MMNFPLQGGEKGGLCLIDLNTSKLNHVQKQTTGVGVCFKFLRLIIFNYNKYLKLFDSNYYKI